MMVNTKYPRTHKASDNYVKVHICLTNVSKIQTDQTPSPHKLLPLPANHPLTLVISIMFNEQFVSSDSLPKVTTLKHNITVVNNGHCNLREAVKIIQRGGLLKSCTSPFGYTYPP